METHSPLIRKALRFLKDNVGEEIDLDMLSRQLRCCKFYLCKAFRRSLQQTPMQWLWNYRVQKAAELMTDFPNLPLFQIAVDCGFKSQAHFSISFRKTFQTSPTVYRRMGLNNPRLVQGA